MDIAELNKTRRASSCGDLSTPSMPGFVGLLVRIELEEVNPTFKVECYNQFVVGGRHG